MSSGDEKECYREMLEEGDVAMSPGVGFGPAGEGYLRLALVENEKRLKQAVRQMGRASSCRRRRGRRGESIGRCAVERSHGRSRKRKSKMSPLISPGGEGRVTWTGFFQNQYGRFVPSWLRDNRLLNLVTPNARYFGLFRRFRDMQAFHEWHYRVDPLFRRTDLLRDPTIRKYGPIGRLWHGSPGWLQETYVGLGFANVAAGAYLVYRELTEE
jgi:hypothetical protein